MQNSESIIKAWNVQQVWHISTHEAPSVADARRPHPQNKVAPFPAFQWLCPMHVLPTMQHPPSRAMRTHCGCLGFQGFCITAHAKKVQVPSREVVTQSHVQGNLCIVIVTAEVTVVVEFICDSEGFVGVQAMTSPGGVEEGSNGGQVLTSQRVQQPFIEVEFIQQYLWMTTMKQLFKIPRNKTTI